MVTSRHSRNLDHLFLSSGMNGITEKSNTNPYTWSPIGGDQASPGCAMRSDNPSAEYHSQDSDDNACARWLHRTHRFITATALTVLERLSLVHRCLLSRNALRRQMPNATYSGLAKSAHVIAVKVLNDHGWVSYLPPKFWPLTLAFCRGGSGADMCAPLSRGRIILADIRVSNNISSIERVASAAQNSGRPSVASISNSGTRMWPIIHQAVPPPSSPSMPPPSMIRRLHSEPGAALDIWTPAYVDECRDYRSCLIYPVWRRCYLHMERWWNQHSIRNLRICPLHRRLRCLPHSRLFLDHGRCRLRHPLPLAQEYSQLHP